MASPRFVLEPLQPPSRFILEPEEQAIQAPPPAPSGFLERAAGAIVRGVSVPQRAVESAISRIGGAQSYEELYRRAGLPEPLTGPYSPLVVVPRMVLDPLLAIGGIATRVRPRPGPAIATTLRRGIATPAVEMLPPAVRPPVRPGTPSATLPEPPPSRFPATPAGVPEPAIPSPTAPFQAGKFGETAEIIRQTRGRLGAAETVQRRGIVSDKLVDEFARDLGIRPDELARLQPGQVLSAEHIASARQILKGSADKVYRLAEEHARLKTPETTALLEAAWQQHAQYQLGLSGVATESGRALRQFSRIVREGIPLPITTETIRPVNIDRLADQLLQAGREGAAATLGKTAMPTWRDMVAEYGAAVKVSGPVTHERNFIGNTLAAMLRPPTRLAAAGIETVRAGITGAPRERFAGEAIADAVGMLTSVKTATRNFLAALLHEGSVATAQKRAAETGMKAIGAIPGKAGRVIRLPFRLLTATDEFFREINRRGALYGDAYRQAAREAAEGTVERNPQALARRTAELATNPSEALAERAQQIAAEYLYQEPLPQFAQNIMKLRNSDPTGISRLLFPFVRTPINIMRFTARHTPAGALTALTARGPEVSDRLGRSLVGSMVAGTAVLMAAEGRITGAGPADYRQRALLRSSGWQPYSIKIGDTWISYRGFEPVASFLSGAASFVDTWRDEKDAFARANRMAAHVGQFILDSTYLTSLKDIFDAVQDPGSRAARFITGFVTGMIPRAVSPLRAAFDPLARESRTASQAILRQIPIASRGVSERLDVFGRPVVEPGGPLRGLVPPRSPAAADPVVEELSRLGVNIPQPRRQVRRGREQFDVPDPVWRRLVQERGGLLYPALQAIVTAPGWDEIPDETKQDILEDTIRRMTRSVRPLPDELQPRQ